MAEGESVRFQLLVDGMPPAEEEALLEELRGVAHADSASPAFAEQKSATAEFVRVALEWGHDIAPLVNSVGGGAAIGAVAKTIVDQLIDWSGKRGVKISFPYGTGSISVDAPNAGKAMSVVEKLLKTLPARTDEQSGGQ